MFLLPDFNETGILSTDFSKNFSTKFDKDPPTGSRVMLCRPARTLARTHARTHARTQAAIDAFRNRLREASRKTQYEHIF